MTPITAAAIALPSDRKRALRPSLTLSRPYPTRPRLMAAIVGPMRQLATACRSLATTTGPKLGHEEGERVETALARARNFREKRVPHARVTRNIRSESVTMQESTKR